MYRTLPIWCWRSAALPTNAVFNTWWFRQNEKARAASFLLAGSYFLLPHPTVFIMISFGWHAVFYIFGVIGILIGMIWYFFARNKPEQHPKISQR